MRKQFLWQTPSSSEMQQRKIINIQKIWQDQKYLKKFPIIPPPFHNLSAATTQQFKQKHRDSEEKK